MSRALSRDSVVRVTDHQVSSDFLDDEIILLDVHEGVYYGLNPVGARIWRMIQNPRSVGEIVDELLDSYHVDEERCLADVTALLDDLLSRRLIEVTGGPD